MTKYKKLQNVEYISGYDHYDRHRDILINFKLNEAEKAANVNILEVVCTGSYGRLYIGGEERDVDVAYRAAEQALEALTGRPCPFSATE